MRRGVCLRLRCLCGPQYSYNITSRPRCASCPNSCRTPLSRPPMEKCLILILLPRAFFDFISYLLMFHTNVSVSITTLYYDNEDILLLYIIFKSLYKSRAIIEAIINGLVILTQGFSLYVNKYFNYLNIAF